MLTNLNGLGKEIVCVLPKKCSVSAYATLGELGYNAMHTPLNRVH